MLTDDKHRAQSDSSGRKRLRLIVSGRVQGVGYRYFVSEHARVHAFRGWVRNCRDGTVELEVQGPAQQIYAFCDEVEKGPPLSKVADIKMREIPCVDSENSFTVRY
jgi:acylphosphatase